jgi:hypothetical protein
MQPCPPKAAWQGPGFARSEGVKNSRSFDFRSCRRLIIEVGARHGVPLRGLFHTFPGSGSHFPL